MSGPPERTTHTDPLWRRFSHVTRARIGLGRSGDAIPTEHALDFHYAHACARDAVLARADFPLLAERAAPLPTLQVHSAAADRSVYLRRPDLGRVLDANSATRLPPGPYEAVFVIADGLSARAVETHALPLLQAALPRLTDLNIGPLILAAQGRVALGDEIGSCMRAELLVMLIGERPGLSVPDSLGVYLTYGPQRGRRDAERNCISNIHADGLSYAVAADKLVWLMAQARVLRLTGVALKEDAPALVSAPAGAPPLGPAAG